MRIESLSLTNLNSLKGTWQIDFTDPAYRANGIFAITGPTGAGKSTILDGICLALYGQTPRLSSLSQSQNELMTRGEGLCQASVVFSVHGKRYRAAWRQVRARQKAQGALQQATAELCLFDPGTNSWKIEADKIKATSKLIPQITGMTFEQFTRTMLLAQGNFAAFLKSKESDRAEMLEQITGTGLYSQISTAVYERYSAEKEALDDLNRRRADIGLLTEEERNALTAQKTEHAGRAEALKAKASQLTALLQHFERQRALQSGIAQDEAALAAKNSEEQEIDGTERRLAEAARAEELAESFAALKALRENKAALIQSKAAAQNEHARLKQELALRQKEYDAAKAGKEASENALAALTPLAAEVKNLDARIAELQSELTAKTKTCRSAEETLMATEKALSADRQALQDTEARLQALAGELESRSSDKTLSAALPEITRFAVEGNNLDNQLKKLEKDISATEKKRTAARTKLQSKREEKTAAEAVLEGIRKALDHHRDDKVKALGGQTPEELLAAEGQAAQKHADAKSLQTSLASFLDAQRDFKAEAGELKTLESQGAAARGTLAETEKAVKATESTVESLTAQIEALNTIERLSHEREALEDGAPCPLCGAVHHPYKAGQQHWDKDTPARQLKEQKKKVRELKSALTRAETTAHELAADFAARTKVQEKTRQALTKTESELRKACVPFALKGTWTEIEAQLPALIQISDKEAAALSARLEAYREAEKHENAELSNLTRAQSSAQKTETAAVALEADVLSLENRTTELTQNRESAATLSSAAKEKLLAAILPYGITWTDQGFLCEPKENTNKNNDSERRLLPTAKKTERIVFESTEALLEELKNRAQDYQKKHEESGKTQVAAAALRQKCSAAEARLASDREVLAKAKAECDEKTFAVENKHRERRALFGDKNPQLEVSAAEEKYRTTRQTFEDAGKALEAQTRDLAALGGQIESAEKSLAETGGKLAAAESRFTESLTEKGFDSETLWSASRLTPAQRNEKTQRVQAFRDEKNRLTARLAEKRTALAEVSVLLENQAPENEIIVSKRDAENETATLQETIGRITEKIATDDAARQKSEALREQIRNAEDLFAVWSTLNALIGSHDGKKYRTFVQGLTFSRLVSLANESLVKLTDRYLLVCSREDPLALDVIDNYRAGTVRSSQNLSGGESFLVSLALALGLSRLASQNMQVDSLFLDEGFGTLDEEALEAALSALSGLHRSGKLIGVISHVGQIRDRIPTKIEVTPAKGGVSTLSGPGVAAGD